MSMYLSRREFMRIMGLASAAGLLPHSVFAQRKAPGDFYDVPMTGNLRVLHFTDTHAQLLPVYFREPNVNIGVAGAKGKAPHLVGEALLNRFDLDSGTLRSHAYTYLNYEQSAETYGKVGGFAHLATLINRLRAEAGEKNTLLLDGGDTWQGSGTAWKTLGMDMVGACNRLGVDVMTGHWEFTYHAEQVLKNIHASNADFVAQNINATVDAIFEGTHVYDEDSGRVFPPYVIRESGGVRVAIVGQAFPYTPIANPRRFIPDWTFGINESEMQQLIDSLREMEKPDAVILLSHNGMDVDLKMAGNVTGIDVIMGGHTHDGVPAAIHVKNAQGITLVTNAGSNGKFLGVMDLDIKDKKLRSFQYRLLPVFSNLIEADKAMSEYIATVRKPHAEWLNERLAVTEDTLYRRGNFNGTFDQVICNALREQNDAQISLSPGFRWGTTVLAGQTISMENVLDQTCMTYPETYRREISGQDIKLILEDVCDNLYNPDPYRQQGGDMVRLGGLDYVCDPTADVGQRVSNLTLDDGTLLDMNKKYVVAGWATVASKAPGPPVWEQVADYLREHKTVEIKKLNTPKLVNVSGNPGIADYSES